MRRNPLPALAVAVAGLCILLPVVLLAVWSVAGRWPWPELWPESFSLRGFRELFASYNHTGALLLSSVGLSLTAAALATLVGAMTARALAFHHFPGKGLVRFGAVLPILVPGTVLAMGLHTVFLRLGLADTLAGVVVVHVITALPYTVSILTDVTQACGKNLEEQAAVLGASPARAFLHGTLPALAPGLLSAGSMAFAVSYSQYFTTLLLGGGQVRTLSLVMVPYIQSGDRTLASIYALLFVGSALAVFAVLEGLIHLWTGGRKWN